MMSCLIFGSAGLMVRCSVTRFGRTPTYSEFSTSCCSRCRRSAGGELMAGLRPGRSKKRAEFLQVSDSLCELLGIPRQKFPPHRALATFPELLQLCLRVTTPSPTSSARAAAHLRASRGARRAREADPCDGRPCRPPACVASRAMRQLHLEAARSRARRARRRRAASGHERRRWLRGQRRKECGWTESRRCAAGLHAAQNLLSRKKIFSEFAAKRSCDRCPLSSLACGIAGFCTLPSVPSRRYATTVVPTACNVRPTHHHRPCVFLTPPSSRQGSPTG